MLQRKAYSRLLSWKNEVRKKALCIIGARQIGKTTLIRHFARENYKHFVEINFVTDPKAAAIFDGDLSAESVITNLTAFVRAPMVPGKTLVFFDEVQEVPTVRTAMKFLVEDGRFDYIESGSMLGIRHKEITSYPVGFEEIYPMVPMDLEEFFWANGVQASTIDYVKECYSHLTPPSLTVHQTLQKLFLLYLVVGGMPRVVQIYVDTHDIGQVIANQRDILDLYRLDIAQYVDGNDKLKIRAILDSIPAQLSAKNRRFFLRDIHENARQNRYEDSFRWLSEAGVALPCYNISEPKPPIRLNEKHNIFKLFMGDTGLLCAASMENIQFEILRGDVTVNLGSVLENAMAQQFKANGFSLNYFDSKKYGELDFVLQNGSRILAVEVKSGGDYRKHSSLDKVRSVSEWSLSRSIVFCRDNLQTDGSVEYLPWYMAMLLAPDSIPQNQIYQVDLSGL